ncbi:MAG: hypothetical protein RQ760_22475, partial [Sedimentisphaerales bacterium]|nr:hypothetical protein [Sedimentisphaerales bacterium]
VVAHSFAAGPGEASASVAFTIDVAGQTAGTAELDLGRGGEPLVRRQTVQFPEGVMRVVERYSDVEIELPRAELATRVTNAYPAYSPDGAWIAYMSNADGDFDIYVMNLAEGVRRQLTDAPGRDGTPAWSPDGSRIAFQSYRDGPSQVYVMDADGENQRNLSNGPWNDEHPTWSSDGKRILFASDRPARDGEEGNIDLYEMRADGSDVRRITTTPEVETYPSWSPDGSRIACRKILPDGDWEVVVMRADGSDAWNVAPHPAADGWPAWS